MQNFHGKYAFIRASNVSVIGGDFGSFDACASGNPEDAFRLWGGSIVAQPVNDVVDGVTIHDVASGSGNTCQGTSHAGYHVDCMQNQGGQNITVRNSKLAHNCPTSGIQMEPFSGATIGNVTIENNFFGPSACCNSIVLGTTTSGANCSTLVIRYNVLYNTPNPDQCASGANGVQVYGNVFPRIHLLLERRVRSQRLRGIRWLDLWNRSEALRLHGFRPRRRIRVVLCRTATCSRQTPASGARAIPRGIRDRHRRAGSSTRRRGAGRRP